ncbi:serine/threonine protein kinase [Nonomuraea sp. KC401]|uniref:serine/threonine-protein kinase n=1 Tax=unclassified Nonomuraea TaxID=2593643 RepID=UPI0010FE53F8|nr:MULTISPECIES: serine/threonine-protein kinase [unclassified Nonomuraea]NBE97647.1 protein kinase [Nonomuraea sp. K271]TLF63886.1 serine/threonine protein kinase [Nonomuraea sp. KC401]
MASIAPLRPGDPPQLGGLELAGRLGEGGQGVVYLAHDPSGARVAVKWMRSDLAGDQVSVERFLREVEVAQQVAPFCTAAVLGTGVEQHRPYIVSEFIEGPSLHQVVTEQGPRSGSVLHRLAIGTATALAAIHQAGIVHRDFKPANVIIGADGPRVIDFGIARALNATSTISGTVVGTPAYMAPEQIMGHTVGPAADLFSWASSMVFAASARAPFGSDTMPAVINRVLNQHPDLGMLDDQLRDVVTACLAKDPAQRPTAEQVIMRLLQRPSPNAGILAEAAAQAAPQAPFGAHPAQPSGPPGPHASTIPPPYPPEPWPRHGQITHHQYAPEQRRRNRTPLIVGVTVGLALLMLAGVVVTIQVNQASVAEPSRTRASEPSRTTATRGPSPGATRAGVPPTGTRTRLPGGEIYLYEHPDDAVFLTSYEIEDEKKDDWIDYARTSLHGSFTKYAANWESMVSPDGRYLAHRGRSYSSDDYDFIVITDQDSGKRTTIKTVKDPLISTIRAWSKDGGRILLNIEKKSGDDWLHLGYTIIDVATEKATTIDVADTSIRETAFGFDGADEGTVNVYGDEKNQGLRFFDAAGKATRSFPGIGTMSAGTQDIFSPSGGAFVTNCPNGGDGDHCIWDSESGERLRKFSSDCDKVLGFYDEKHLYCWEQDNDDNDQVQVIDFSGKLLRKLLEVPDDLNFSPAFTINPDRVS